MEAKTKTAIAVKNQQESAFLGQVFAFNNSLKLHHWHVTGEGSYSCHIALDQALADLLGVTDRLVETTYALLGDLDIVIPQTSNPTDIIKHAEAFYSYTQEQRELYPQAYVQAILDDYQEAIQQLLYRLKRLK